ncbi:MAG: pantoate--beta-alanine ligase [Nitrospira sp.]|nr:pantoate--beta-alanine ligase [Nitrospira sp.]
MRIIRTTQALRTWRRRQDAAGTAIGLVPTMGALHAGHRSLMQRARRTCRMVVVSLFVNPLQFGPEEDYRRYPRTLSKDLARCRDENVDLVFMPKVETLYPHDFQTTVAVSTLAQRWEGERRPTHFQGVTTVVTKLLNLVRPDRAFFGQKDYQQYCLIRQLVKDLDLDTRITLCPTIRDDDGLALSSRNRYVTKTERQQALALYQALSAGKEAIARGTRRADSVKKRMAKVLGAGHGLDVDYLTCCDARTLEPLSRLQGTVVLLGAIRVGGIRFIDNFIVRIRR